MEGLIIAVFIGTAIGAVVAAITLIEVSKKLGKAEFLNDEEVK